MNSTEKEGRHPQKRLSGWKGWLILWTTVVDLSSFLCCEYLHIFGGGVQDSYMSRRMAVLCLFGKAMCHLRRCVKCMFTKYTEDELWSFLICHFG